MKLVFPLAAACAPFAVSSAVTIDKRTDPAGNFNLWGQIGSSKVYVYEEDGLAYLTTTTVNATALSFNGTAILAPSGAALHIVPTSGTYEQIGFSTEITGNEVTETFLWYGKLLMWENTSTGSLDDLFWAKATDTPGQYELLWNSDFITQDAGAVGLKWSQ
ncbi:hypothetical protein DL95DRAFT_511215 [Leptodontidium sp. 2 PMI_412]|nr:hypothetical protein DL95DRAFT_511215 [Leptodontidium sp. 2 PMI_412]